MSKLRRLALAMVLAALACTASAATPPPTTPAPCRVVELPPPGHVDYSDGAWTADGITFAFSHEEDELRWSTDQCAYDNRTISPLHPSGNTRQGSTPI